MPIPRNKAKKVKVKEDILKLHAAYGFDFIQAIKENTTLMNQIDKKSPQSEKLVEKTIKDGIDEYLTKYILSLAKSSQETYKSEARLFLKYCDEIEFKKYVPKGSMDNISTLLANPLVFLKYLEKTENQFTRNKRSSFIRSFLKAVSRKELLNSEISLAKVLPIVDVDDDEPKAFNREQIKELLSLSRQGNNNLRNHSLIWVLLGSGIRVGEVVNLTIEDILPEKQEIYVIPQKKRGFPTEKVKRKITKPALEVLMHYVQFTYNHLRGTPKYLEIPIFSKDGGKSALTTRTVQGIVRDLIDSCVSIPKSEKENFSTHSFRHSFALSLLESGVDIYTISKLIGHENVKATEVYLKLFEYQLQEAIEKHPFAKIELENGIWREEK